MSGIVFFIYIAFSIFLGLCYLSARRGRRNRCLVLGSWPQSVVVRSPSSTGRLLTVSIRWSVSACLYL